MIAIASHSNNRLDLSEEAVHITQPEALRVCNPITNNTLGG